MAIRNAKNRRPGMGSMGNRNMRRPMARQGQVSARPSMPGYSQRPQGIGANRGVNPSLAQGPQRGMGRQPIGRQPMGRQPMGMPTLMERSQMMQRGTGPARPNRRGPSRPLRGRGLQKRRRY